MRFFSTSIALFALAAASLAAVTPLKSVEKYQGQTTGRYIVRLKQGVSKDSLLVNTQLSKNDLTHEWDLINGFAGHFSTATLNKLLSNPDVETVSEDGIATIFGTQTDAPWGLGRISSTPKLTTQDPTLLTYTYSFPDDNDGLGVDIYVVDTGVLTTHVTFGGRATWGATFGGYANADGNGHGTHCAGTAAGLQYGVAKNASIIAVKVLSDSGSGAWSDVISGLNWVQSQAATTGRPSIVTMSLGGSATSTVDSAVASLTSSGVHVAVAAGNSNTDAGTTSPAREPSAVTVGASTIADARASFSNYGSVVDIFAPGQDIISSWIGSSNTATNRISGTSMATPHIAGLLAYLIARDGNVTPTALSTKLQALSVKGALTGIPSGTVNYLAHNQ